MLELRRLLRAGGISTVIQLIATALVVAGTRSICSRSEWGRFIIIVLLLLSRGGGGGGSVRRFVGIEVATPHGLILGSINSSRDRHGPTVEGKASSN